MSQLSLRDRELVALGAAIAANCIPCVEFHIPKARDAGISDTQLDEVLALADKVRRVPAKKVLAVASRLVNGAEAGAASTATCAEVMDSESEQSSCC